MLTPTNAASSGIKLEKPVLKPLTVRSDAPGLRWLGIWVAMFATTSVLVWLALGTWWLVPAMLIHGTVLTVPSYAVSHECAHGTAFRSRWINETVFWISSFLYLEEPLYRRYSHTRHHTYTWHEGMDSQMPFSTPLSFGGWLAEVSGIDHVVKEARLLIAHACRRFSDRTRSFTPETELPKLTRNARFFLTGYAGIALYMIAAGHLWPLWFIVLPRLLGGPVMLLFTLIQHVEMEENAPSILHSTRSFRTNWLGAFLYMNMNNHIEHHLYPMVPFHKLPDLSDAVADRLPAPDPGVVRTNLEVLGVVIRRSLGGPTRARSIRQAPHMITTPAVTP